MKLFSVDQIKNADAYTIKHEHVKSLMLMERAAARCTQYITAHFDRSQSVLVMAGPGNNGGDGLAIARMLIGMGYRVDIVAIGHEDRFSEDCSNNLERLRKGGFEMATTEPETEPPAGKSYDLGIDAFFGSGLNGPVKMPWAQWPEWFNRCTTHRIAIDIPSGLHGDKYFDGPKVRADLTLSLQSFKRSFLLPESEPFTGRIEMTDIGLSSRFMEQEPCKWNLIDLATLKSIYRKRTAHSHKGKFGHALLIAGDSGKFGAAILAAAACIRGGAGLTTLAGDRILELPLNNSLPEAMFAPLEQSTPFGEFWQGHSYSAVGIGPGMGKSAVAMAKLNAALQHAGVPLVLDADAINLLAGVDDGLSLLPENTILTPHPGEFSRIFDTGSNRQKQLKAAQQRAIQHKIIIVLKGAYTCVALPDGNMWFNATGNAGLAKGGSGDVLTGLLTALLASGYSPREAALLGVWLHGTAADSCLTRQRMETMKAGDVTESFQDAFKWLES